MVVSLPYSDAALGHRASSPDVCVCASLSIIQLGGASLFFTVDKAIKMVQQEGSDIENDVDFDERRRRKRRRKRRKKEE